jgi:hypothetical protein
LLFLSRSDWSWRPSLHESTTSDHEPTASGHESTPSGHKHELAIAESLQLSALRQSKKFGVKLVG